MLVIYGSYASLIEAKKMLYVADNTSIHVTKLFAAYAYGPIDRDVGDYGSLYDTYIFMELIEGEDLLKSWGKHPAAEKEMISADLTKHMMELRSLPAPGYNGSVDEGPVSDLLLEWSTTNKSQSWYASESEN
jgi:hypothetical protein